MDQRDSLIDQLSQLVTVNTATQSDGSMNVSIGTGQALVTGSASTRLTAFSSPYNASEHNIGIVSGGNTTDITSQISGGSLGGLLTVRSQVLDPTVNQLGQFSVGLATIVNQAQASGMDLTGATGQPMFAVGGVLSTPASTNMGSSTIAVTRGSLSALDGRRLSAEDGRRNLEADRHHHGAKRDHDGERAPPPTPSSPPESQSS